MYATGQRCALSQRMSLSGTGGGGGNCSEIRPSDAPTSTVIVDDLVRQSSASDCEPRLFPLDPTPLVPQRFPATGPRCLHRGVVSNERVLRLWLRLDPSLDVFLPDPLMLICSAFFNVSATAFPPLQIGLKRDFRLLTTRFQLMASNVAHNGLPVTCPRGPQEIDPFGSWPLFAITVVDPDRQHDHNPGILHHASPVPHGCLRAQRSSA